MHYFLYPTKDTTLSNHPNFIFKNMGLDEVLEVEKRTYMVPTQSAYTTYQDGTASVQMVPAFGAKNTYLSRAILHFNLTEISRSITNDQVVDPKFFLSMKVCEAKEVPLSYTLVAYPLAKEWTMGTGYKYDGSGVADGASWKYSNGMSSKWWASQSLFGLEGGGIWYVSASVLGSGSGYAQPPYIIPNPYDPFPYCGGSPAPTPTPSPTPTPTMTPPTPTPSGYYFAMIPPPGGEEVFGGDENLFPLMAPVPSVTGGLACHQSFDYQSSDVHMNITPIVNAWLSNTIPNYGLIVMHSGELDEIDYGKLRFFSKETNTIYSPHIDVCWDDSTYSTGSGTGSIDTINLTDAVVSVKNMVAEYRAGSIIQFRVTPRKRYPIKTFTNKLSDYLEPYVLPFDSFYSIMDAQSEEIIIPFDCGTRLSASPDQGNYFFVDTTGLAQERHYKIQIRSEQNGTIVTFDIPTTFKITR